MVERGGGRRLPFSLPSEKTRTFGGGAERPRRRHTAATAGTRAGRGIVFVERRRRNHDWTDAGRVRQREGKGVAVAARVRLLRHRHPPRSLPSRGTERRSTCRVSGKFGEALRERRCVT